MWRNFADVLKQHSFHLTRCYLLEVYYVQCFVAKAIVDMMVARSGHFRLPAPSLGRGPSALPGPQYNNSGTSEEPAKSDHD